jgi:uncharacterized protein
MVVISDTSCLSTFTRIGKLDLLRELYQEVVIPKEVLRELQALNVFGVDVSIFSNLPWLKVRDPVPNSLLSELLDNRGIDPGEAYAIALALELRADWLILDDLNARQMAQALKLNITGLGGVLLQAKDMGIIPAVKPLLDQCVYEANFRLSDAVFQKILHLAGE